MNLTVVICVSITLLTIAGICENARNDVCKNVFNAKILLKLSQVKLKCIPTKFSYLPTSFKVYVCIKLVYFNYSA